jgi:hypothetical protein
LNCSQVVAAGSEADARCGPPNFALSSVAEMPIVVLSAAAALSKMEAPNNAGAEARMP